MLNEGANYSANFSEGGWTMAFMIYDNQKDRWAMIHRLDCGEYITRLGDKGWHGPYSSYELALDDAVSKRLGAPYPCKKCTPTP